MKQKLKQFWRVAALAMVVLLAGCEKEVYDAQLSTGSVKVNPNLKAYYIEGSKAKAIATKMATTLSKNIAGSNSSMRITNNTIVDYSKILVIENERQEKTYSFKVESLRENEKVFQNLILLEKNGFLSTKMLTYIMSDEFAKQYADDVVNISQFQGTIEMTSLSTQDCCGVNPGVITIGGGGSEGGDYTGGEGHGGTTSGASGGWGIGGTTGSSGGSSSGGNGSGATSSGSVTMCPSGMHVKGDPVCRYTKVNNAPVLSNRLGINQQTTNAATDPNAGTPPELCCIYDIGIYEDEESSNSPCEKLKNETEDETYMSHFNNINTPAHYTSPVEIGFFQNATTNNYTYGYSSGLTGVKVPEGSLNFTHVHNNKPGENEDGQYVDFAVKIFSPGDLTQLIRVCQPANADPTNAFGVLISDEGIFAMTLLEPIDLYTNIPNWDQFLIDYKDEATIIINDTSNTMQQRKEKLQKMFLQGLKSMGLENKIGFFEGQVTSTPTGNKINWTRKTLNNNNSIIPNPC